jgi:putative membrane protein
MNIAALLQNVMAAAAFSLLGIALFAFAMWLMTGVVPFSIRKEIEEDQNVALGIVMGSIFIGIAIIVAAAIHG